MDEIHSEEYIKNTKDLTPKKLKMFSEKMEKLRKPFLCNENPQNFITFKKHDYNDKDNIKTVSDINSDQVNLSSGQSSINIETSDVSDYFTDDSKNITNSLLESDTSMDASIELFNPIENSSISDKTNNSTNVLQENSLEQKKQKINLTINHRCEKICTSPNPLILINGRNIIPKTFAIKQDNINHAEHEENKRLRAKIIQLELYKQIENKDKAMAQLLELSQYEDFPKLKHLCNVECVRDKEGMCKKIKKLLKNGGKQNDEYYGVLNYVWSTITYPFSYASPIADKPDEGVVKVINLFEEEYNIATKRHIEQKNLKKTLANGNVIDKNYMDHKNKTPKEKTRPHRITDYIWGGQRGDSQELVKHENLKENDNYRNIKKGSEDLIPKSEELNQVTGKIHKKSKTPKEKIKSYRITDYIWGSQKEESKTALESVEHGNSKENVTKPKIFTENSTQKSEEISPAKENIEKNSKTTGDKSKSYRITDYIWGVQREELLDHGNLKQNTNENAAEAKISKEDSAHKSKEINPGKVKNEKRCKTKKDKTKSYRITNYIWGGQGEDNKPTQELLEQDNLKDNLKENAMKKPICNEAECNYKIEKIRKKSKQTSYFYFFQKDENPYHDKNEPQKETDTIESMEDIFHKMAKEEHSIESLQSFEEFKN